MQDELMDVSDLDSEGTYNDDSNEEALDVVFQYNIDSYTNAIPVERLINDFNSNIIKVPAFQRPYVWNRPDNKTGRHRPSLFIDSILLGLPIPPISIYKEHNAREEGYLIDGRQRLVTISAFKNGKFDDGKPFILKGEGISSEWKDKGYSDLSEALQERLDRAYIPVMYIRQLIKDIEQTPGASSIYLLFDRLNSGGYALAPHEKRGVLGIHNTGMLELMKKIYQLDNWKNILPKTLLDYTKKPYNQSLVEEIIFRAVAFALNYKNYNGNITRFLDDFIISYNLSDNANSILKTVQSTIKTIAANKSDFRPKQNFSISLFEAIFVGLYEAGGKDEQYSEKYTKFVKSKAYLRQDSRSLSAKNDVINKFKKAIEIFNV